MSSSGGSGGGAFSLSRGSRLFPVEVKVCGAVYPVNADFRNVLRIFRLLEDDNVLSSHKYGLLRRFFYSGEALPEASDAVCGFADFIGGGAAFVSFGAKGEGGAECEKQFDFEFDAAEIYQSFYSEYGLDLADAPFLHFYKFLLLLKGLSPASAFMRKLSARFMDLSGLKGRELARAAEIKERARLPVKLNREELRELEEFERIWGGL